MKSLLPFGFVILLATLASTHSAADTLSAKTVTSLFVNKSSLVGILYEPVSPIANPNGCSIDYLELDKDALLFKEQYALLLMLLATGKKANIHVSETCGAHHILIDWIEVIED